MAKNNMEERYEVVTIKVRRRCTECFSGEMVPNGITLTSMPPKYPHTCAYCGHEETYQHKYPYIEYTEKAHCDGN